MAGYFKTAGGLYRLKKVLGIASVYEQRWTGRRDVEVAWLCTAAACEQSAMDRSVISVH
jgi:hypothetical protein